MGILSQVSPEELGLPESFEAFRQCQYEAAEHVMESALRFDGLGLPTGAGKSVVAALIQKATGKRAVILTATRGLQDQYATTFASSGMLDIRGKSNYRCDDKKHLSCRFGAQEGCRWHKKVRTVDGSELQVVDMHCTYEGERKRAQWSKLLVTNYAYWIRANWFGPGLEPPMKGQLVRANPVEILILDEAHAAAVELSRALQVVLKESQLIALGKRDYPKGDVLGEWQGWAFRQMETLKVQLDEAVEYLKLKPSKATRDRVMQLEQFMEALVGVALMDMGDWVLEMHPGTEDGRRWEFNCAWPGAWAEQKLFCGVPKVVLMSATLTAAGIKMLGIKGEQRSFREWPRQFPAQRTPVYHIPTVRMNHSIDEEGLQIWVKQIDRIIESCMKYKGLIQTVSYKRQDYLLKNSKFNYLMIANTTDPESETAKEAAERFKQSPAPAILVSPSFGTGWDFPDEECRWIIIAKVPFPEFKSKVMQARLARSPIYTANLCMQDLVQFAGRGTRHEKDWCKVFIVDDSIRFFMFKHGKLAPEWFSINYRARGEALPSIESGH